MQNGELTHALGESAVFPKSSILIFSDDLKHFYADVRFIEERSHTFSQLFSFRVNLTFFGNGGQNPKTNHKLNVRRVLFVCNKQLATKMCIVCIRYDTCLSARCSLQTFYNRDYSNTIKPVVCT